MNDPTTDLLRSTTEQLWPRLPAASDVRRSAERGRRTRRLMGGAAAGVVVAAVLATGLGDQLTAAPRPDPGSSPTPQPSASTTSGPDTDEPVELSDEPFLHAEDWARLAPGSPPVHESDAPDGELSTCLPSPLTWHAPTSRAARFTAAGSPDTVFHEYVLRYDSSADAHSIAVDSWNLLDQCLPVDSFDPAYLTPTQLPQVFDELVYAQRTEIDTRTLSVVGPGAVYQVRIARHNNVVVVLENTSSTAYPPVALMELALLRAVGQG